MAAPEVVRDLEALAVRAGDLEVPVPELVGAVEPAEVAEESVDQAAPGVVERALVLGARPAVAGVALEPEVEPQRALVLEGQVSVGKVALEGALVLEAWAPLGGVAL